MLGKYLIGSCLSLLTLFGGIIFFSYKPLASDKKLTENFFKHRANFEEIVRMMNEDSNVTSIYKDFVLLDGYNNWTNDNQKGFSTKRWNEYKELFNQLGSPCIHSISKDGEMLTISSASTDISDNHPLLMSELESVVISKGYVYSLKEPAPLVESLDEMGFDTNKTYYKNIGEHWYLYFDWGISKPE